MKYPARGSQLLGPGEIQRPVFGFDIDGTMGHYHSHFINFAEGWLGRRLAPWQDFDGSMSLAKFIGVSKPTYRKIKLAYRRGGLKRSMPADSAMIGVATKLRRRGAEIIICTTRPYLSLENIDDDTRHWLNRNGVHHDQVIWGEHKYRQLAKARPGLVLGVVDDLPELVEQAVGAGIPGYLIERGHNSAYRSSEETAKFYSSTWYGILEVFETSLTAWERSHR